MNELYKHKYDKYKFKYLQRNTMLGGRNIMIGGGFTSAINALSSLANYLGAGHAKHAILLHIVSISPSKRDAGGWPRNNASLNLDASVGSLTRFDLGTEADRWFGTMTIITGNMLQITCYKPGDQSTMFTESLPIANVTTI